MPDLALSVSLTRTQLALPDLQINDHANYYVGDTLLGGQQAWERNQVGSPFLDGQVTTYRTRSMVQEPIKIEVLGGGNQTIFAENMKALVQAFSQDQFDIGISIGSVQWLYDCEAADFSILYVGSRFVATQGQVTFNVPRQPNELNGTGF